ncbi:MULTISPECIES: c-type cytochrome [Burkholderia]|jgi:mono/diheme cytochrome c family protein|uniref:Cytochrome c n=2 Tax=Burkholderia contaminans TaxID=488447 RepID=A0A1E3FU37_9BURK|nr:MULTISPECIES: cytochrome c [Burkholderia]UTP25352.1 cytochrome c [Burkholderia sp. FXe9]KKL32890.1 cytochrome C [Burkholderia contaminans LMG 23361]MBA9827572.1 cytochrome c [Burkholderia contaminans]MBA9836418.1 cytochrome c [Burkholderia contaminans]MBA9860923.1 cytochrome c [Burkholderia contaminans]
MLKRRWFSLLLLTVCLIGQRASAQSALELETDGTARALTRQTLLARPDAADIHVPRDIAYGKPMTFRAVPFADLLGDGLPADGVLETRAADGFAAQLPLELVRRRTPAGAVPWLAIEDPAHPWPKLPGKQVSAGPFYLVWLGPDASSVRGEQWPYQIVRITIESSPLARWPSLAVDAALPANDPARAGQRLFVTQCLACHRLDGAGSSHAGPDLNTPMNPVDYFQPAALRRYIRNPASVRDWPGRSMPAFPPDQLSDRELDQIVAYLAYMARRKAAR